MSVSIIYHNSVISSDGFLQKKIFFSQTQHNLAQRTFTVKHMIYPKLNCVSVFRKLREMAILPAILLLLRCQISNKFVMITLAKHRAAREIA